MCSMLKRRTSQFFSYCACVDSLPFLFFLLVAILASTSKKKKKKRLFHQLLPKTRVTSIRLVSFDTLTNVFIKGIFIVKFRMC